MARELTAEQPWELADSGEELVEPPYWFDRLFAGDGPPPQVPEEPERWRWRPSDHALSTVYFLLGLCCGLLAAYLLYHAGGRW